MIVYALYDPLRPRKVMYIGSTSQHQAKRLSDHISEAMFRERNPDYPLSPKMKWILDIMHEKRVPGLRVLETFTDELTMKSAETDYLRKYKGKTLNRIFSSSGKRVGCTDTDAAKANKIRSAKNRYERGPNEIQCRYQRHRAERIRLGFPHPELSRQHKLNRDHFYALWRDGVIPGYKEFLEKQRISRAKKARIAQEQLSAVH